MTKDYIAFNNALINDEDLSYEDQGLLTILFHYYNVKAQCAYPSYEVLMKAIKTKRKSKISKILKSLVKGGYIEIVKIGKKNTYKLLKYLFIVGEKKQVAKKTTNSVQEDLVKDEAYNMQFQLINNELDIKMSQENIKEIAKWDLTKIHMVIEKAKQHGANSFNYLKKIYNSIITSGVKEIKNKSQSLRFNNFQGRNHNDEYYDDIEKRLLGWA